jgi:hypothetical protein
MMKKSTITVSIPKDLKARMAALPHINWPEYLRQRLEVRLAELKKFEELRHSGALQKIMRDDAQRRK